MVTAIRGLPPSSFNDAEEEEEEEEEEEKQKVGTEIESWNPRLSEGLVLGLTPSATWRTSGSR